MDGVSVVALVVLGVAYVIQRSELRDMRASRDDYRRAYDAAVKSRNKKEDMLDRIRGLVDDSEDED